MLPESGGAGSGGPELRVSTGSLRSAASEYSTLAQKASSHVKVVAESSESLAGAISHAAVVDAVSASLGAVGSHLGLVGCAFGRCQQGIESLVEGVVKADEQIADRAKAVLNARG